MTAYECFIFSATTDESNRRRITEKGIKSSLKQAERVGYTDIIEKLSREKTENGLYYHEKCRNDLFNGTRSVRSKDQEKMASRKLRSSADGEHKKVNSCSTSLPFKDRCILCKETVDVKNLKKKSQAEQRKDFRVPDSLTAPSLKDHLLRVTHKRNDEWASEAVIDRDQIFFGTRDRPGTRI